MKSTENFKNTIKSYLDKRAVEDKLFAEAYSKPEKNINDCITYILNTVKKSGCNGFTDDEIYSIAIDFYDEVNIEIGKPIDCHVVVNRTVELTAEEKETARREAMKKAANEAYSKIVQPRKKAVKSENNMPGNLFNF
jgi:hypothetical protein